MTRTETDSLGAIEVPAEAYWGAQTQRSLLHFAIGDERMPLAIVHALALIKKAAARAMSYPAQCAIAAPSRSACCSAARLSAGGASTADSRMTWASSWPRISASSSSFAVKSTSAEVTAMS